MMRFPGALLVLAAALLSTPASSREMLASFYGSESGRQTASGETFRPAGMTAAHRTLPFGTRLRVCRGPGRCVVVRVNDRGPYSGRRELDLSSGAARELGMLRVGVARVMVERL